MPPFGVPPPGPTSATAMHESMAEGGLQVVELRTDRDRNVELHRQIWTAVSTALADGLGATS